MRSLTWWETFCTWNWSVKVYRRLNIFWLERTYSFSLWNLVFVHCYLKCLACYFRAQVSQRPCGVQRFRATGPALVLISWILWDWREVPKREARRVIRGKKVISPESPQETCALTSTAARMKGKFAFVKRLREDCLPVCVMIGVSYPDRCDGLRKA